MSNALKGALWSGLIWPGLGQVVLKRYKRGAAIMLMAGVSLTVILIKVAQLTLAILDKIESQDGMIDMGAISDAAAQVSAVSSNLGFHLLSWVILACWIIGIVDAYRIGRQMDLEQGRTAQPPNTGHQ